ncbi:MAG: hypothetical protein LBR76_06650 [Oscillospiraceae bacterium]|nr:hypothetical protein [Oscillospiraceae bacterium]
MKKRFILAPVMILTLALAACGGNGAAPSVPQGGGTLPAVTDADSGGETDLSLGDAVNEIIDDAIENDSFSLAAAYAAMKERGVEKADVEPVWDYTVDEENFHAYGDSGSYGHGLIRFTKTGGAYLTDGEYDAWAKKLFDATAAISDDGYNIYGYDVLFGENPGADVEISFDGAMGKGSGAMIVMQGWGYKYNGSYIRVDIERAEEKDADYEQDAAGEWVWIYYYNGVQADVRTGLQKSFDDAWEDAEDAFDEYEDEIEDAIGDYIG